MIESPGKLSPAVRWGLVIGLWIVLTALFYLGLHNLGWVTSWAHGILLGCLLIFGAVLSFSLVAAAVHLSIDTIRGRYPYPDDGRRTTDDSRHKTKGEGRRIASTGPEAASRTIAGAEGANALPVAARKRKSRLRVIGQALGVLVATLLMTLVLLEIGLRLFAPQFSPEMRAETTKGLFTEDPATTYRTLPGLKTQFRLAESVTTLNINSRGLREEREIGPPQPGLARVLCVGDSFTFGYGVEGSQAYPYLLNGTTERDASSDVVEQGKAIESINGGVLGYGTDNEAAWLKEYGWQLQPDIVLVGFYVGNDVRDVILGRNKTRVDEVGNLLPSDNEPPDSLKHWLAVNSHAYVFLRGLAHDLFSSGASENRQGFRTYDTAPLYLKAEPSDLAGGWSKTLGLLDSMRADATAHGARFVVVVIPTREQVDDTFWRQMLSDFRLDEAGLQRDKPQQMLAAWSASTGTPLIDLLPGFSAEAKSGPYYFTLDTHWNPAGHALAARLIREGLEKRGLVNR